LDESVVELHGSSVLNRLTITRPQSAILAGTITGNGVSAGYSGGAQAITNCVVSNQSTGIFVTDTQDSVEIAYCTVIDNSTHGVYAIDRSRIELQKTIVWNPRVLPDNQFGGEGSGAGQISSNF